MDFHAKLAELTRSVQFKDWHKNNKKHFLAHAFVLIDDANKDTVQFGFFDAETKTITTWHVAKTIQHTSGQEILDSGVGIVKLEPAQVTLSMDDALKIVDDVRVKEYSREIPLKKFFIIQMIDNIPTYNMTIFTQSFSTINVKVDATNGKLLSHTMQKLMEFG